MGLEDTHAVVIVDDQAGQAVTLAVDEAVAVGRGRSVEPARHPNLESPPDHLLPEIRRRGVFVEAEDADGDRADLVMAGGEVFTLGGIDAHQVALGGIARDPGDGPGEDPGMEPEDGILAARTEKDFFHQACSG